MNIQIFGKNKCFDTKKAQRYFKERGVKFQSIDLLKYGISRGELTSVKNAVGLEALLDPKAADAPLVTYLAYDEDKLEKLLEGLSPREATVLRMRFGLVDGRPYTLEEVGKEFNVTRERIRQIESKALRKLRHPSRSKLLRDFLN